MTNPEHAYQTVDGRRYRNPTSDDPDREYTSITTGIAAGSPKFLDNHLKLITAETAVWQRDQWLDLPPEAAIKWLKEAADRHRDLAGAQGTEVHAHMEGLVTGQPPLFPPSPGARPYVEAGKRFLDEWAPNFLHPEVTVYSDEHGYAGTADGFVTMTIPNLGHVPMVIDYKSGKHLYDDAALQLAALRHAEYIVRGRERLPMPDLQAGALIHLHGDGTYAVHIVECGPEVFADFLAVLEVARVMKRVRGHIGPPTRKPPPAPLAQVPAPREEVTVNVSPAFTVAALTQQAAAHHQTFGDRYLVKLAELWPAGLPTLRQAREGAADLGTAQLAIIAELVDHAAGFFQPFPEDPNPPPQVALTVVGHRLVERATVEEHEQMIDRLKALPADLLDAVQAEAAGKYPNLRTGQFTPQAMAELDTLVQAAETEQATRFTRLCAALAAVPDDTHQTVLAEVGIGDIDRIEAAALERLEQHLAGTAA